VLGRQHSKYFTLALWPHTCPLHNGIGVWRGWNHVSFPYVSCWAIGVCWCLGLESLCWGVGNTKLKMFHTGTLAQCLAPQQCNRSVKGLKPRLIPICQVLGKRSVSMLGSRAPALRCWKHKGQNISHWHSGPGPLYNRLGVWRGWNHVSFPCFRCWAIGVCRLGCLGLERLHWGVGDTRVKLFHTGTLAQYMAPPQWKRSVNRLKPRLIPICQVLDNRFVSMTIWFALPTIQKGLPTAPKTAFFVHPFLCS
jgi:hypothetical protein